MLNYIMTDIIKQQSRREYFRQYYLKNKNKKRDTNDTEGKKRGRPRKIIEPFSIIRFDKPITLSFN